MAKNVQRIAPLAGVVVTALFAGDAFGQQFVSNTTDIPQGSPNNSSRSENVDFADIDLDGDWDAAFANGGNGGNDQNRIWLNRGPNLLGIFVDVTNTHAPAFQDRSRDIEFADIDNDGDVDAFISNTQITDQSNRWWINSGVGSGMFVDETASRWVNVGVNDGVTTFSSVAPSMVLGSGGFIDWSCDSDFGDLDNDGDLDLFQSTYGPSFSASVPSRIFLNDGNGFFEEFNPSGFQLTGMSLGNGQPAIWAEGVQMNNTQDTTGQEADITSSPLDVELIDTDGDLDLDILHGGRNEPPRLFENQMVPGGPLVAFRDVTFARLAQVATGGLQGLGNYEQEFGDIDNDGDLDLYGLNWSGFNDTIQFNDGTGNFGPFNLLPGSGADDTEGDFFDYDNDGDLDLFVANFSGPDKLYQNDGNGNFVLVNSLLPGVSNGNSLDGDMADVDGDGDYDIFVAEDNNGANIYLENTSNVPDTTAPTLYRLEQAPDREPGAEPTVVRVQVYDNTPYYITWYNDVVLEYSLDGGAFTGVPMRSSGGQIFRGEIPGTLAGTICYRAHATDEHGNTSATTPELCFDAGSFPMTYCTPKLSSAFCLNVISTSDLGANPVSGASDYFVTASDVQGFKNGLLFAGVSGPAALPFGGGTLCVQPPTKRGPVINSGGVSPTDCSGSYSQLVNDGAVIPFGLDAGMGNTGWYQWWYRDPGNGAGVFGTALSDGVELSFQL